MGILDDAIRQHLELKRRQGAEEEELQRLEDEAFGPPSRPGDPEFGEASSEGVTAQAVETAAEREPGEAEPATDEGETGEGETGESPAFFDQTQKEDRPSTDEQMALDSADEPASEAQDVPVSSLDTVEHPFEANEEVGEEELVPGEGEDLVEGDDDQLVEGDDEEPFGSKDEHLVEGDDEELVEGEVAGDDAARGTEDDEEDVLEETPEFLRDAPEDDELWFEQGEPKDFDF